MTLKIGPGVTLKPGITARVPAIPNGLSAEQASTSAWQIKQDWPNSSDGVYWIKNTNINGGQPFKIYADMTTAGGGWTLLVQSTGYLNPYILWDNNSVLLRNQSNPPTTLENYDTLSGLPNGMDSTKNYSILGWADFIKKNVSGNQPTFDYMIDAAFRGRNGAAYTVNENYSFTETYTNGISPAFGSPLLGEPGFRKNITELEHFPAGAPGDTASWTYDGSSVEARMPYIGVVGGYLPGSNMLLGTNGDDGSWWGTIISLQMFSPAPWFGNAIGGNSTIGLQNPRVIWYWVR
jgi:hypothetical protein